jgi:hypothetical protein
VGKTAHRAIFRYTRPLTALNYSWVLKESKPDLMPPALDLGASLPPVEVAVPGKTQLI